MPFDINTAKPIAASSGFDISTAKPINDDAETVFREETGQAISAPSSVSPSELEYLDNTQNRKIPSSRHFGFVDLGDDAINILEYPASLFKGAANSAVQSYTNLRAGKLRQLGEARKEVFSPQKPIEEMSVEEKLDAIRRSNTPYIATLLFGSDRDKQLSRGWIDKIFMSEKEGIASAESTIAASKKIQEDGKKFIESANLVRPDGAKGFIFDVGSVGTTIGASIGLAAITKNPVASAVLFKDLQKDSIYLEAMEKGWDNMSADKVSEYAGNFNAALEFIGVNYFLKAAEKSKPLSRIGFRMFEESLQEGSQQIAEEAITQAAGLREVDLQGAAQRTFYSMVLGALGGGAVATTMEIGESVGKKEGLPKNVTDKMAEKIHQNMPEIKGALGQMVIDESSPLKSDPQADAAAKKILEDFNAGKPIDGSSLSETEQKFLAASTGETVAVNKNNKLSDKEGYPIQLYHSTKSLEKFPKFDVSKSGQQTDQGNLGVGVYLSPSTTVARGTTKNQGRLINATATLENPIELVRDGNYQQNIQELADRLGVISKPEWSGSKQQNAAFSQELTAAAIAAGYDGIIARAPNATADIVEAVVFNPDNVIIKKDKDTGRDISDESRGGEVIDTEADYRALAEMVESGTLYNDTKDLVSDGMGLAADAFVPVSTRLGKINEKLKHAVRKFVFNTGLYTHQDRVAIKPFVESASKKMSELDYRILDLALKNGDMNKVNELLDKYDMQEEYKKVREVLDQIHAEALDVGIDVGYIENYFPRRVKPKMVAEYMAFLRGQEQWSDIRLAMQKADPNGTMTVEEQAEFANNYLRGYRDSKIQLARPDNTKERSVDYITADLNRFYEDSMPTLLQYVGGMRHGIESRKLFGKSETETEDNIGAYVLNLIDQGVIKPHQELELRKLLKAVVEPTGTRGLASWAKNASYIYLMGNPISAITQIQDLAFSLHHNGYYRTLKSLTRSIFRQSKVTKEDMGLENILHEFEDKTRAGEAVRKVFSAVGLSWMDNIGKETYMGAALERLKKQASKNKAEFNESLDMIFGDEAESVRNDLANNDISENVLYLLFSELSNVQPISLAEMPRGYLRGGNGRIFYMLKSYTIKQIDIYRREIFDNITSGEPRKTVAGLRNLISLATSLMLMGMGTDALKDLLLGREIDIDELVMTNIIKMMGITKYQIYEAKDKGIMNTFWKTLFVPPVGAPIDDAINDVVNISTGNRELKDSEVAGKIPFVGKFYFWWWGGGRAKEDKKSGADSDSSF